ncbi:ATP-binding Cassette (ABC) Superfamily [Achlya hypogyna]|uniref:ATP-binding Cassette (ABC) Superfamily n=1 Tax=Achlya hypogyna TaxID=1202772 RepID=A0A1V9Z015_ACHHY|nr:ATP-binding Cassette (ABC) Superfamily [Achlya hypogyna]
MRSLPTYGSIALGQSYSHHPVETAGLLSRLTFSWVTSLIKLGNQRQLQGGDLWPLPQATKCAAVGGRVGPVFASTHSLLRTFVIVFGGQTLVVGILQLVGMVLSLAGPIVLQRVVSTMSTADPVQLLQPVGLLFGAKVVQAIVQTQAAVQNELLYVASSSALQDVLFHKTLALSAASRRTTSTGEVANLIASDTTWLLSVTYRANQLWILPLQVAAVLGLLWIHLGAAMLVGVGLLIATLFVNRVLASRQRSNYLHVMELKDVRMKVVNEVFGAMTTVKLQSWEEVYEYRIQQLRAAELKALRTQAWFNAGVVAMNYATPVLLATASFATHVLWLKQPLSAPTAFAALSLFAMIKAPMTELPEVLANWLQASVSYGRINAFLAMPETDPAAVTCFTDDDIAVDIVGGVFGYEKGRPVLPDVNLCIRRGELVVLHGPVGGGKTTLCLTLLGEVDADSGTVAVGGRIAYFGQQPWLQSTTIRNNILFGLPFDSTKYNAVLDACALHTDLAAFAAGDSTEIGAKGVTVSGGQKARIALARACYSGADIFILDAPLAAVDAIVQNEIFTKCILGLLRHKTVVLVTHSPDIIASPFVDRTIEIRGGQLFENHARKQSNAPASVVASLPMWSGKVQHSLSVYPAAPANTDGTVDEEQAEEERSNGRVSSAVVASYIHAIGGWSICFSLLFIQCVWQGLQVGSDLWLSYWTGDAKAFQAATTYVMSVYTVLALGSALIVVCRSLAVSWSGLAASRMLFDSLIRSLLRAPLGFFDTTPVGRVLQRFAGDMNLVDSRLPFSISAFLGSLFTLLVSIATTMVVLGYLSIALVPLLYIYFTIGSVYIRPARELERLAQTTQAPVLTHIAESIDGAVVVRAFGHGHRFQLQHQANVDRHHKATLASDLTGQWFGFWIQLVSAAMLLVSTASLVYLRDSLSPGLAGLVFAYALQTTANLEGLVTVWSMVETAMVAPERIATYLAVEPEAARVIVGSTPLAWPTSGCVTFERVSFRYKPEDPLVLSDLSFDVAAGEKIGIVGRTGAGKSSLVMALFRIREVTAGSIRIDGLDTCNVGLKTLRESMCVVSQSPVLIRGSLRDVLDPTTAYADDQLWDVLKKVKLAKRVEMAPGQLQSRVEENGDNFSVGERQMLALARALLRKTKIVVLDEATAAIDRRNDENIQQVIRDAFEGTTVLTIAHRLDTVLDCNRILVLDKGRCVEFDTPQRLLAAGNGTFFDLCDEGGYLKRIALSE